MSDKTPPQTHSGFREDEIREMAKNWRYYNGTAQEIIRTTSDKIKLCLREYQDVIKKQTDWITPLGILIALVTTLVAADFKTYLGITKETWEATYVVSSIVCGVWFVLSAYHAVKVRGKGDLEGIVQTLKQGFPIEDSDKLGRRQQVLQSVRQPEEKRPRLNQYGILLEKIDFAYQDSPTEHGWQMAGGPRPSFKHISDRLFQHALEITPSGNYAMDSPVTGDSRLGTRIEFVAKPNTGFTIYAKIDLQHKDGSKSENCWLAFRERSGGPKRVGGNEWSIPIGPIQSEGEWGVYRIDLREAVMKTFGSDGWSYESLKGFRLRHKLSLAYISILSEVGIS